MNNPYVLIHGAWHGAWCWEHVSALLENAGKKVIAVDLPGHGNSTEPIEEQDIMTYAKAVRNVLEGIDAPAILVGHSMGGFVISQTAEFCPKLIDKLIYVSAFLPQNGKSMEGPNAMGILAWEDAIKAGMASLSETKKSTFMTKELAVHACYNDLSDEEADYAYSRLCPESVAAQYQEVCLGENFRRVPKIYVKSKNDNCIPYDLQERMIEAQPCVRTYTLNTAHCPFLSDPEALTDILLKEG